MNNPLVSIITVCFNSAATIGDTISSVLSQDYKHIELIIVDGDSTDGTQEIIQRYKDARIRWVSEKDKGLYDALNKGLRMVSGDIISILHSDDFYAHAHVITDIVSIFDAHKPLQAVSSSVNIYKNNRFDKPFRVYSAKRFRTWQFRMGMQPPHPGFFITANALKKIGDFNTEYRISADFDWLLRAIKIHKVSVLYTNYVSVHMRDGGISSSGLKSKTLMNKENLLILKSHGISSNLLLIYSKYFLKVFQLKI